MTAAGVTTSTCRLPALLAGWLEAPEVQDREILAITLDSRQIRPGSLFLACAGIAHHGLEFLQQAVDRGAAAVLGEPDENWSSEDIRTLAESIPVPLYPVARLSERVSAIAGRFYGDPSHHLAVFGITGTNGKTSCSHFLAQVFSPEHLCGVIGTVGSGLLGALETTSHTTPDAVTLQAQLQDLRNRGADMVAMEVSSHALDQGRAAAVRFDVALLTNLTQDHLDYHNNMAAYGDAKLRLFTQCEVNCAVLNMDDPFSGQVLVALSDRIQVVGYSALPDVSLEMDHWVRASCIVPDCEGMSLVIDSSWGEGHLSSRLLGRFNVSNLLAVLAVMLYRGISFAAALEKLAQVETVAGRMERFGGDEQPLVVVDYAHTPDALEHALVALREHVGGRLICLFGCGGDRDRGKRPLMGAIAERLADRVIVTDDNPRGESGDRIVAEIVAGMDHPERARVIRDRAEAIALSIREAVPGDLILIAGKGHETYQLVGDQVLHFSDREQVEQALTEVRG
ncbi:UDP-N-acetylmuramoyl-L-alanyl-D-glutamate--2,6-diaminopimelate ligase [Sedimenticola sp.]|uniref:UDP-N-acetylmuramoyl-L-alanyl-D-glutamate--2, 6-diaminopimelate ligase n=1 Tax=Sedimenticola sp. TaxID=1940285 RepID=UPI003D0C3049